MAASASVDAAHPVDGHLFDQGASRPARTRARGRRSRSGSGWGRSSGHRLRGDGSGRIRCPHARGARLRRTPLGRTRGHLSGRRGPSPTTGQHRGGPYGPFPDPRLCPAPRDAPTFASGGRSLPAPQEAQDAGRRAAQTVPDQGVPPVPAGADGARRPRDDRPRGPQARVQEDPGDDVRAARLGHREQDRRVDEVPRPRRGGLRQGRVQPQGLQRHGRGRALQREQLRLVRLHRRRLLARRLQGRPGLGRARRPQRQRVRGLQHVREPEEPAAHRGVHDGRHRLGDLVGLRHHRHHDGPGQPAQVRRLRRRLRDHAGHRRPGALLSTARSTTPPSAASTSWRTPASPTSPG